MPNDLDPDHRLTLRQADQTREDFAQILDELDFVRSQIARRPKVRFAGCHFGSPLAAVVFALC